MFFKQSVLVTVFYLSLKEEFNLENTLWVIDHIPKHSKILLIDMQEQYFREVPVSKLIQERIQNRLSRMKKKLLKLKEQGYHIYAAVDDEGIIENLHEVADFYLPTWCNGTINTNVIDPAYSNVLQPEIIETFSDASSVVVCGLWRELCVYTVTRLLQKEVINAYLSIDPDLSFENAMMWEDDDVISLEGECRDYNVTIKKAEIK